MHVELKKKYFIIKRRHPRACWGIPAERGCFLGTSDLIFPEFPALSGTLEKKKKAANSSSLFQVSMIITLFFYNRQDCATGIVNYLNFRLFILTVSDLPNLLSFSPHQYDGFISTKPPKCLHRLNQI